LIDDEALARLAPGTVIIDLAAETGGNTSRTERGETVTVGGVKIIGSVNLPSQMARDASRFSVATSGRSSNTSSPRRPACSFVSMIRLLPPCWASIHPAHRRVSPEIQHELHTLVQLFVFLLAGFVGFQTISEYRPCCIRR